MACQCPGPHLSPLSFWYRDSPEEQTTPQSHETSQATLRLQGGPGCASLFGMLYELGPDSVQPDLRLKKNPGAWNFEAGLLFMDQPIGTGFSPAGAAILLYFWLVFLFHFSALQLGPTF